MTLFYQAVANVSRWVLEWAERRLDRHERHIIDLMKEAWVSK